MSVTVTMSEDEAEDVGQALRLFLKERQTARVRGNVWSLAFMFGGVTADEANSRSMGKTYAQGRKRHKYPKDRKRRWSREDMLQRIRDWTAERGKPPSYDEWGVRGKDKSGWTADVWPSSFAVQREFGKWSVALRKAGVK